jgi:selenocysteine lyase/cysteine desulfurase
MIRHGASFSSHQIPRKIAADVVRTVQTKLERNEEFRIIKVLNDKYLIGSDDLCACYLRVQSDGGASALLRVILRYVL